GHPNEVLVLEVLRDHGTVPVPHLRDVKWNRRLIVIDCIRGCQLSLIRPTISDGGKASIAKTLKEYVQQLRQFDIPQRAVPGPLDPDLVPQGRFSRAMFGNLIPERGPFGSYRELEEWYNHKTTVTLSTPTRMRTPRPSKDLVIPKFDSSYPIVLTHQDLNPRNMIVGNGELRTLWIVDWTWSGFYPE
ncbi:hypothetical protein DL96DRAFT_1470493, partial [Flagelloscypha sp. PMI_526]